MVSINSRGRSRLRWLPFLAGALAVTAAVLALLLPRVVGLAPEPGSKPLSGSEPIVIHFSQKMNPASLVDRFSVAPPIEGRLDIEAGTVVFRPDSPWPAGAEVVLTLGAGARSQLGLPLLRTQRWEYEVAPVRLLYLLQGLTGSQLVSHVLGEAELDLTIGEGESISEFALGPGGMLASLSRDQPGPQSITLRVLFSDQEPQLMYTCRAGIRCLELALSQDGQYLAWAEREIQRSGTGVVELGPSQVWVQSVERPTPFQIGAQVGELSSPRWLQDGRLAAYSSGDASLHLFARRDPGVWPELARVEDQFGSQWSWSPDSRFVVFPQVELLASSESTGEVDYYSHLVRVEAESGVRSDLSISAGQLVEDAAPSYSPDGLRIAFSRRWLDPARWTLGRQLWVMRSDGTAASALTDAPAFTHSNFAWDPNGSAIAYMRVDQTRPEPQPEIWVYDFVQGTAELVVEGGHSPQWLDLSP